jgi:hypothetical protein
VKPAGTRPDPAVSVPSANATWPRATAAAEPLLDPPASHRDGPIFLDVLRVVDIPEALGLLAPRPLAIYASDGKVFDSTAAIYRAAGGELKMRASP